VNKAQLIDALIDKHHAKRENYHFQKADMTAVVDGLGELVAEQLRAGHEVTLPGIGKLTAAARPARTGRNPQTGEAIEIPAAKVPKFKAAKALKEAVNHG